MDQKFCLLVLFLLLCVSSCAPGKDAGTLPSAGGTKVVELMPLVRWQTELRLQAGVFPVMRKNTGEKLSAISRRNAVRKLPLNGSLSELIMTAGSLLIRKRLRKTGESLFRRQTTVHPERLSCWVWRRHCRIFRKNGSLWLFLMQRTRET